MNFWLISKCIRYISGSEVAIINEGNARSSVKHSMYLPTQTVGYLCRLSLKVIAWFWKTHTVVHVIVRPVFEVFWSQMEYEKSLIVNY